MQRVNVARRGVAQRRSTLKHVTGDSQMLRLSYVSFPTKDCRRLDSALLIFFHEFYDPAFIEQEYTIRRAVTTL